MQAPLNTPDSLLQNYDRYDIEFTYGNGYYLYDSNNKQYVDFLSGIAVTSFGHRHMLISSAVESQIAKIWHTSNLFQIDLQKTVAQKLASLSGLDKVFFCNSGTEANEAAIKMARKYSGQKTDIICMEGGFHGRSLGALSATASAKYREGFAPLVPGFSFVPYGSIQSVADAITAQTCAVLLEPVQGESGVLFPPDGFLKSLRKLCSDHGILLIVDEVQAGLGRTGKHFAYQWEDITPDIVTVAKGIANGLPLGAVLCTNAIADVMVPGTHGSTFGGNPVALAATAEVLELLTESLLQKIYDNGQTIMKKIQSLPDLPIIDIRGRGLIIGIQFPESIPVKQVAFALLQQGIVTGTSGNNTLRLLPPFIIDDIAIERFIHVFHMSLTGSK